MFQISPNSNALTAVVIPGWMFIPLIVIGLIAVIVIVVVIIAKFSVNSKKLKEAGALLEMDDLSGAFEIYQDVMRSSVAAVEFKILPTDKSVFEKAIAGLHDVYEAAGRSVNLDPIVKMHSKWQQLQTKHRKSATRDYSDEMTSVRKKAVALVGRLPSV